MEIRAMPIGELVLGFVSVYFGFILLLRKVPCADWSKRANARRIRGNRAKRRRKG